MAFSTWSAAVAEAVAVGAAVDLTRHRGGSLAGALGQYRLRKHEWCRALGLSVGSDEGNRFQDAPAHVLSRLRRKPGAEQATRHVQRLPFQGVGDARAALVVRLDFEDRAEATERPPAEHPGLPKVPADDPLVRLLFPFQCEAGGLTPPPAQNRPIGLRCLVERVGRQAQGLVEPVGVGQYRPESIGWQVECPGPRATHGLEL